MARKPVFYSFHFDNDVMRVQQIRNIGALDGNLPVSPNEWESIKRSGDAAVKRWIDDNMKYKRCVIVLVGSRTAYRPWVQYEIQKAWNEGRGLFGIHIHNLRCPRTGTCTEGPNPFDLLKLDNGLSLSSVVNCYNPNPFNAYRDIAANIEAWVDGAIAQRARI